MSFFYLKIQGNASELKKSDDGTAVAQWNRKLSDDEIKLFLDDEGKFYKSIFKPAKAQCQL